MRALPTPPELIAPGCRVTAVSCNSEQCAAAFSLPRSRPEVVVWSRDGASTSYVAPESRMVTALALPPDACETTVVGGGDDRLFAVVDGRARRLSIKCSDAGCCACDESGAAVAAGCRRRGLWEGARGREYFRWPPDRELRGPPGAHHRLRLPRGRRSLRRDLQRGPKFSGLGP